MNFLSFIYFSSLCLKQYSQSQFIIIRKFLALFFLLTSSCSHLGTIVDKDKISKVQRVAIIGFSVMRFLEEDKELVAYKSQNLKDNFKYSQAQRLETRIFDSLTHSLKKRTGWEVLNPEELMTSKTFLEKYKSLPEKVRKINKLRRNNNLYEFYKPNTNALTIDNILDFRTSLWLTSKDLVSIAKELNVDAFGFFVEDQIIQTRFLEPIQLVSRIKKFRSLGDNFRVKSVSSLRVLSPDKKKVILQIQNRFGPKLSNNDFNKSVKYRDKLNKLCLRSSQSAMNMNMIMNELY